MSTTLIIILSIIGIILLIAAIIIYFFKYKKNKENRNCGNLKVTKDDSDKIWLKKHKPIKYNNWRISPSGIVISSGKKTALNKLNNKFVIKNLEKEKLNKINLNKLSVSITSKLSAICIAPPGSGKTQALLLPTILYNIYCKEKPIMIITDPKPEIYDLLKSDFIRNGYKILKISTINLSTKEIDSDFWNPLEDIIIYHKKLLASNNELDIQDLKATISNEIDNIINAISGSIQMDHWNSNGLLLIKYIISLLLYFVEQNKMNYDHINLSNVLNNINNIGYDELKFIQKNLDNNKTESFLNNYSGFLNEREENINSFKTNAATILAPFQSTYFKLLTSKSTFDLDKMLREKHPLAIILNINTSSTANELEKRLINIYLNMINKKIDLFKKEFKQNIERPVYWLIDEAGNLDKINFLENIIAFGRGYKTFALPIFQSYNQIETKYSPGLLDSCEYRILFNNDNEKLGSKIANLSGRVNEEDKYSLNNVQMENITSIPFGKIGLWTFKRSMREKNFYLLPITYFYMIEKIKINNSQDYQNKAYLLTNHEALIRDMIIIDNNINEISKIKPQSKSKKATILELFQIDIGNLSSFQIESLKKQLNALKIWISNLENNYEDNKLKILNLINNLDDQIVESSKLEIIRVKLIKNETFTLEDI